MRHEVNRAPMLGHLDVAVGQGLRFVFDLPPSWHPGSLPGPTHCPPLRLGRRLAPEARGAWGAPIVRECSSPANLRLATLLPRDSSRCWPGSVSEGSLRAQRVRSARIQSGRSATACPLSGLDITQRPCPPTQTLHAAQAPDLVANHSAPCRVGCA